MRTTERQLKRLLAQHSAWLQNPRRSYTAKKSFASLDLTAHDLLEADLREARLDRADLSTADLSGASLERSCCDGTRLWAAYLDRVKAMGAIMAGANLMFAKLRDADLTRVSFTDARCDYANFSGAKLLGANFMDAVVKGACFTGADFGLKTLLAKQMLLLGCCWESCLWVDQQPQGNLKALFSQALPRWQEWLEEHLLGQKFTPARFNAVVAYALQGVRL